MQYGRRICYNTRMLHPITVLMKRLETASYRELARELGFSAAYLNEVVHKRRPPSDNLAEALGLERIVTYRKKRSGSKQ